MSDLHNQMQRDFIDSINSKINELDKQIKDLKELRKLYKSVKKQLVDTRSVNDLIPCFISGISSVSMLRMNKMIEQTQKNTMGGSKKDDYTLPVWMSSIRLMHLAYGHKPFLFKNEDDYDWKEDICKVNELKGLYSAGQIIPNPATSTTGYLIQSTSSGKYIGSKSNSKQIDMAVYKDNLYKSIHRLKTYISTTGACKILKVTILDNGNYLTEELK